MTKHSLSLKPFLFSIAFFHCLFSWAQSPIPPTPVEFMFGHRKLDFQLVYKKNFSPESKFSLLTISVFSQNYDPEVTLGNSIVVPVQVNYALGKKGFALAGGIEANSIAGVNTFGGLTHSFANRKFLAITVWSFFFNEGKDMKLFGLYEFKPQLNEKWTWYNRMQFVYNTSLSESVHNRSFLYLRSGLKTGPLAFGLGADWDSYGPNKINKGNFGVFTRWEF